MRLGQADVYEWNEWFCRVHITKLIVMSPEHVLSWNRWSLRLQSVAECCKAIPALHFPITWPGSSTITPPYNHPPPFTFSRPLDTEIYLYQDLLGNTAVL
jgi:hypothetical protein